MDADTLPSQWQPIDYGKLSDKQKEIRNYQAVAGLLSAFGYECIWLRDDYNDADFRAYHMLKDLNLPIQLKPRMTIAKRYERKNPFMVFPIYERWHLIRHNDLLELVKQHSPDTLLTQSWNRDGFYSWPPGRGKSLHPFLSPYELPQ